jgi:hypothetical protein
MKAGVIIFLAAHVLPAVLLAATLRDVVWVLIAAGPFLGVRLLWSLIAIFGKDGKSKIAGSDPWVNFGTGILEEFVIVCVRACVRACVCMRQRGSVWGSYKGTKGQYRCVGDDARGLLTFKMHIFGLWMEDLGFLLYRLRWYYLEEIFL